LQGQAWDVFTVGWANPAAEARVKDIFSTRLLLEGATDMRTETEPTESSRQYAAAYAAHYTERDLPLALQLYQKLMASHPNAQEAGYARMQVQNITNAVVPKQELLEAQIKLARVHFEHDGFLDAGRLPGTQLSEESDEVQGEDHWRDDGG
jgi:hypothetical protein